MLRLNLGEEVGVIREYRPNVVGSEIREGSILNFTIVPYEANTEGLVGYVWGDKSREIHAEILIPKEYRNKPLLIYTINNLPDKLIRGFVQDDLLILNIYRQPLLLVSNEEAKPLIKYGNVVVKVLEVRNSRKGLEEVL